LFNEVKAKQFSTANSCKFTLDLAHFSFACETGFPGWLRLVNDYFQLILKYFRPPSMPEGMLA